MAQTWQGERGGRSPSAGTSGQERKFGASSYESLFGARELADLETWALLDAILELELHEL